MSMSINHKDMVTALAKPGQDIIDGLTPESAHLLHMSIGVSGEVGELIENYLDLPTDRENQLEELGDIEFYCQGVATPMGADVVSTALSIDTSPDVEVVLLRLAMHSAALLDAAKKFAIYVKPIDSVEVIGQLAKIRGYLNRVYRITNLTRDEALLANINKLGERYSAGSYSDKQAQVRADKT